jgi:hypothetical protein
MPTIDFTFTYDGGTIATLQPNTEVASDWIEDNVRADRHNYLGSALAIEHRYIDDILAGIVDDGLTIERN